MRQRWGVIGLVAVVSFFTGGWLLQRGSAADGNVYQQARLFDDVLSHVSQYYVDSLSETSLYRKATDGLLSELHDPYSVLLVEDDYKQLTETTTGNYGGLGIQIDVRDGWITVVAPLPESPAEQAGIETGDQIIEVDGKSTQGWSNERAVNALRGEPGSKVHIKVERTGISQPLDYDFVRARIHLKSVPAGTLFPGGVGYISLNPVSESSAAELQAEISSMIQKGMKSMIFDLRGNPGGLLDQGVKVSDLFLEPKQEIVSTRGRARGSSRQFFDDAQQLWPNLPIVVLVNEGSASAAEIIAGALQDHDRAVVVGTPTFGKGLVQTLFTLGENVALKLTTARWYTPSGRTIQRVAKNEEDQFEMAARDSGKPAALLTGADTAKADSVAPIFHTDAGRTVRGGGGIVPDILMRPDSATAGEKAFIEAVGSKVQEYRDVLTTYALDLKKDQSVRSEDFTVTPAMRAEVVQRLARKKVTLTPAQVSDAGRFLDQSLAYEVARYVFGRPAEFRRRARDDRQIQTAIDLLKRASTPRDLLGLARATTPTSNAPSN
ncbi:MAG: S41 family peptidase [Gemmatimonadota bacterium]